jgi:hypothetical protein
VTLAGFELGNEINSPMFNSDFSMPAENPAHSREFNVADLAHDPEAQQVARGYLQYLKLLAVIKDVRSRSRLNQQAVIVRAGLVFNKAPAAPRTARLDAVSATATLDFMRANGLDDLADVYGVHTYPSTDKPGNPATAAGRRERLQKYVLAECRPQGSGPGKRCWITEWGAPIAMHPVLLMKPDSSLWSTECGPTSAPISPRGASSARSNMLGSTTPMASSASIGAIT